MPSIPISSIVKINPSVLNAGGNAIVLNGLMLTENAGLQSNTMLPFPNKDAVANFFGPNSDEARLAAVYFNGWDNSTQKPSSLYFFRRNSAAIAGFLRSGSMAAMSLSQLQALSGTLTIDVAGTPETSANINLAAATSFSNAASIIEAAFANPAFTATYDAQHQALLFTTNAAGATETIAYATGTLAAGLMLTQATGAVLSQGSDAMTPAATMANVLNQSRNWAGFMTVTEPDLADKLAYGTWTSQQNKRFVYAGWDTDITATEANNTTAFGPQAKALALEGVVPVYNTPDVAAFLLGCMASINFTQKNGRITFAFKSQSGLATTVNDATTAANLIANGYNFYGSYANATNTWNMLQPGSETGAYSWLDELVNEIWLTAQLETAIVSLMVAVNSIPYNTDGYGLIEAACMDPIQAALNFGMMRPGVSLSNAQAAEVNATAGVAIDKVLSSAGYYLQILDATAQVRGQRLSPPISLWYMDGGSVQSINMASIDIQ